jgi:hypothetical protein
VLHAPPISSFSILNIHLGNLLVIRM